MFAPSGAVPLGAREWGRGILGKGMAAKEWGRGDFLSSFLCLHSFAKSVSGIGVQIPIGYDLFLGLLSPVAGGELER